jgi:Ca2+-binding RTX toxin-like protein
LAALLDHEQALAPGLAYGGTIAVEYALSGSTRGLLHSEIQEILSSTEFGSTLPQAYQLASRLQGTDEAETLVGTTNSDRINGGAGADLLVGGVGSDDYVLARGYGIDTIQEDDATAGNADRATFATGIASDQLWLTRSGDDLEISVIGTTDKFVVADWYAGDQHRVEQFRTADGKVLVDAQVQNLVNAMASFAPPAMGQTTLPPTYASSLQPTIAANWQ